ncbi:MAG: glycoside hydrolase family 172 protein [Pseudomonadota bacterium]
MTQESRGLSPLRGLPTLRKARTRRFSSYDPTGGNDDRMHIPAGGSVRIAGLEGAGTVTHIWMTLDGDEKHLHRKVILRAWWDGEDTPSIEAPTGDFFGMGHAKTANFASLPLQMSPEDGRGMNCYFPMPFGTGMRMEVENQSGGELLLYYYIDLELHDAPEEGLGRFHAQFRMDRPKAPPEHGMSNEEILFGGETTDASQNYVLCEAEGHGHYVGCTMSVYSLRRAAEWDWYGEGDDMIFVDGAPGLRPPDTGGRVAQVGEKAPEIPPRAESAPGANDAWPPTLHGTGTEDYFNTAWCPTQEYSAPYHGIIAAGGKNWSDPVSLYRFHLEDPVIFQERIRVTIEHGHANRRADEISSVAYWYQSEPHKPFDPLPPVAERLPAFRAPYEQRPDSED